MKKILYFTALLMTVFGLSVRADESSTLSKNTKTADTSEDYAGKLGAGVIVGEPTGGSVKYWFNDTLAIDGAVGWSSHDNTDLYLHSDVLWHNFDLIPVSQGRLPVYFGAGGLVRFRDDNKDNQVGVRVPVGLSYMFDNAPLDVFAELGPALDVAPHVRGEITGGIGIRYWF
ncbi:MAG: hypothetical protein PHY43_15120 [Verrucomicrobiales bacterium]|nr:hypothetical protein [Verrucomicrobiales bacterium]